MTEEERIDERDDRHMVHVHTYMTEADVSEDHQHVIMGVTAPAHISGMTHNHRIRIRTSYLCEGEGIATGHWHWVDVMTGPPIEVPDGSHIHFFEGETSFNDEHCHTFTGSTGIGPTLLLNNPDCIPKCKKLKRDKE